MCQYMAIGCCGILKFGLALISCSARCRMKSLALAVSLLSTASALSPHIRPYEVRPLFPNATRVQNRIYGGTSAYEGQFPYMVFALMYVRGQGYAKCSSSLINPQWVLLAAHCLAHRSLRPEDILLVAQKADLWDYINERLYDTSFYAEVDEKKWGVQERRAEYFFIHPLYSPETLEHDVGLVRVRFPFLLGSVQTIPISTVQMQTRKTCTVLGWGLTLENFDSNKLNYIEGKEVSTTRIGCKYKEFGPFICLRQDGTGICKGDSGGPLVCDGKVWGVASHYVTLSKDANCGESLEEYYSELYGDLNWIKSIYRGGGSIARISLNTVLLCLVLLWLSAKR